MRGITALQKLDETEAVYSDYYATEAITTSGLSKLIYLFLWEEKLCDKSQIITRFGKN